MLRRNRFPVDTLTALLRLFLCYQEWNFRYQFGLGSAGPFSPKDGYQGGLTIAREASHSMWNRRVVDMPILEKEVSLFPQQLLADGVPDEVDKWYVVYTRSRHEKSLARCMHKNQMSFFLPLISKEQFLRGRRSQSYLPVFSGYMFYFGNVPDEVLRVAPYCVSSVIAVNDQKRLQQELLCIHNLLAAGVPLTVEARLAPGRTVRVKTGAFRGMEGTIIRRKSGSRLLVSVNYLQQGISVEIDDFMVEAL